MHADALWSWTAVTHSTCLRTAGCLVRAVMSQQVNSSRLFTSLNLLTSTWESDKLETR